MNVGKWDEAVDRPLFGGLDQTPRLAGGCCNSAESSRSAAETFGHGISQDGWKGFEAECGRAKEAAQAAAGHGELKRLRWQRWQGLEFYMMDSVSSKDGGLGVGS